MKTKLLLKMLLIVIIRKMEVTFNQIMIKNLSFTYFWRFFTPSLTFRR